MLIPSRPCSVYARVLVALRADQLARSSARLIPVLAFDRSNPLLGCFARNGPHSLHFMQVVTDPVANKARRLSFTLRSPGWPAIPPGLFGQCTTASAKPDKQGRNGRSSSTSTPRGPPDPLPAC